MSDLGIADSAFNPFVWAASQLPQPKRPSYRDIEDHLAHSQRLKENAETMQVVHRAKPTPENTGAPIPGYRVRGPVNPSTTGAPMPGTLKTKTSINPITQASVTPVPVKPKGAKPTPAGIKPKK